MKNVQPVSYYCLIASIADI